MFTTFCILLLCSLVLCNTNLCTDGDHCVKYNNLGGRMFGGEETERNSRPFQVALYSRVGEDGETGFCGGVLVDPEWVITAAHCCYHHDELVDTIRVVLGAHSLYDRYENGRRVVNIDHIVVHPDWDPETIANDIALIKLANEVQLTDSIDLVRLPYLNMSNYNFAGQAAYVSGWGIPAEGVNFITPMLRTKVMPVLTNTICNSLYSQLLPNSIICAYDATAGTCKGDNGGPMTVHNTATEEDILIGIASFVGESGCNVRHPSVFTRITLYMQWISEVSGIELV